MCIINFYLLTYLLTYLLKCTEFNFGCGQTKLGSLQRSLNPSLDLRGLILRNEGEGREMEEGEE